MAEHSQSQPSEDASQHSKRETAGMKVDDTLWGEYDTQNPGTVEDTGLKRVSVNLTQAERDLLARLPRPLPLEGPRIYQPGNITAGGPQGNTCVQKPNVVSTSSIIPCTEIQPRDPYVLGGLELLNYAVELRRVLGQIEERHSMLATAGKMSSVPQLELPPAPPQLTDPLPLSTFTSRGPFRTFSSAADRDYRISRDALIIEGSKPSETSRVSQKYKERKVDSQGLYWSEAPECSIKSVNNSYKISLPLVRNVLRKSVAAVTAFQGYDVATDAALDMLTDATSHFIRKFCLTLRANRDKQLLNSAKVNNVDNDTVIVSDQGFADIMDRTFREISNLGEGLRDIPEYYSHFVIGRYHGIVSHCRQLLRECHHHASLDAAYPNMASATLGSSSNLPSNTIHLATGFVQPTQIVAVSSADRTDHIIEHKPLISDLHLPTGDDDLSSDGTLLLSGTGASSILGAVLSGPQAAHPVHPLVHPSGSISIARAPSTITSVASNNVPTFSLDHNTPQIESGLQMLQSLEQGGHFAVSGTLPHDTNSEDHEPSLTPILSGFVGASPVLELQSQSIMNSQSSLLLKTTNSANSNTKTTGNVMSDNLTTVSANVQNRKRRTPEGGQIL